MCTDPKIAKRCFDDSKIASTPIECGEGFQISGCWWVTGYTEVIREILVSELPTTRQRSALCRRACSSWQEQHERR